MNTNNSHYNHIKMQYKDDHTEAQNSKQPDTLSVREMLVA